MARREIKIISGGQIGVDRAALDAALACGAPCGGKVPRGRRAEDGRIDDRYPMTELDSANYAKRTRHNVLDSDGTVIVYVDAMTGGTRLTEQLCQSLRRPLLAIDIAEVSHEQAVADLIHFVDKHRIAMLNVAGPRHAEPLDTGTFTCRLITALLIECGYDGVDTSTTE